MVCMALLVISLTETILIVHLVHKQDLQPHVPEWVKHLLLERATVLLCIRDREQLSPNQTQSLDISRQVENNDSTGKGCTERSLGNWRGPGSVCIAPVCTVIQLPGSPAEIPVPLIQGFFTLSSLDPAAKLNPSGCEDPRECEGLGGARPVPPFAGLVEGSPLMLGVLREMTTIRQFLEKREEFRDVAREWLQVGYVLDVLLFRTYLAAVLAYGITLGTLWSVWRDA